MFRWVMGVKEQIQVHLSDFLEYWGADSAILAPSDLNIQES